MRPRGARLCAWNAFEGFYCAGVTHVASPSDLARIVRAQEERTRRLAAAIRLVAWVGTGKPVTSGGVLRPADAVAAARACGLPVPSETPGEMPSEMSREMSREIPGLPDTWGLALFAGLV